MEHPVHPGCTLWKRSLSFKFPPQLTRRLDFTDSERRRRPRRPFRNPVNLPLVTTGGLEHNTHYCQRPIEPSTALEGRVCSARAPSCGRRRRLFTKFRPLRGGNVRRSADFPSFLNGTERLGINGCRTLEATPPEGSQRPVADVMVVSCLLGDEGNLCSLRTGSHGITLPLRELRSVSGSSGGGPLWR